VILKFNAQQNSEFFFEKSQKLKELFKIHHRSEAWTPHEQNPFNYTREDPRFAHGWFS